MQAYAQYEEGEENTNSDYVKFDSFFLCDLDGDGYAEKVRGTCKEIGSTDTLYMELNVIDEGYLKDGKITINSDNFYFQTAIVKDSEIKDNYISVNTKSIALNQINNGTQKMLSGFAIYELDEDGNIIGFAKDSQGNLVGRKEIIDEVETYIIETNENGEISCGIRSGLYKAIEIENLEKYDLPEDVEGRSYYFGIEQSKEEKYTEEYYLEWENKENETYEKYDTATMVSDGIIAISDQGDVIKYDFEGNIVWENRDIQYEINPISSHMNAVTVKDGIIMVTYGSIIKYDFEGNLVWQKNTNELFDYIMPVEDGVIIVRNLDMSKYDLEGNMEWKKQISDFAYNSDLIKVEDGLIVAQHSKSNLVKYDFEGNKQWTKYSTNSIRLFAAPDGFITVDRGYSESRGDVIKYDLEGNVEWKNTEKSYYYAGVTIVSDGVIAVSNEGQVVKYDLDGNIMWENFISTGIVVDKGVFTVENGIIAVSSNATVMKFSPKLAVPEIPELQEITVDNYIKQLKITTDVKERSITENGITKTIRGGNITGEDEAPYETVKYGSNSQKEIKAVPDAGYKVISITVNDEEIPFNKEADGSVTLNNFINMTEDKDVIVTFSSTESNVIVNHYLANRKDDGTYEYTTTSLADKENIIGTIGDKYTTSPKLDIYKYELIKDESGNYVLPTNASGVFTAEDQEVIYYYVKKQIPLTVHHYINGTETKVPSKTGGVVEDVTAMGEEGATYTTQEVQNVSEKYRLVRTPENAIGTYEYPEVTVTYYYEAKMYDIITEVRKHEETDILGVVSEVEGGTISGKNQKPYDKVEYGENSTKEILVEADEGYKIKTLTIQDIAEDGTVTSRDIQLNENTKQYTVSIFEDVTSDKHVIVEFERIKGTVIVHYYLEGTTEKVLTSEGVAEDINKTGNVGAMYATKEPDNLLPQYELIENPENAFGEYIEGEIVVTYYYRLKDYSYTVEYYYDGIKDEDKTETGTATHGEKIETYEDKNITGYKLEKTEKLPLTVSTVLEDNVIKIYYVKDKFDYTVEYYYDGIIDEDKTETTESTYKDVITEYTDKVMPGYKLDEVQNLPLTVTEVSEDNVIKVYYVRKDARVIVRYVDENTDEEISTREIIDGKVFDKVDIAEKEKVIDEYEMVRAPEKEAEMTEEEQIFTYYYAKKTRVVVEYLEKDTEQKLAEDEIIEGYEGKDYTTEQKEIENYTFVEIVGNAEGKMPREEIIVKYYYLQNTSAKVEYIDKITGEILQKKD